MGVDGGMTAYSTETLSFLLADSVCFWCVQHAVVLCWSGWIVTFSSVGKSACDFKSDPLVQLQDVHQL